MTEPVKTTYASLDMDDRMHREYENALRDVESGLGRRYRMHIGKEEASSPEEFTVRSPLDRDIILGIFQKGKEGEAKRAIEEAKRSFPIWSGMEWSERVEAIRAAADILERQKFSLAAIMTYEVGKVRTEGLAEIGEAVDMLRYYARIYEEQDGYLLPLTVEPSGGEQSWSVLRPYGTWAVISPFNFPIALAAGMCSAALISGNTVVFKPTSEAPLSALKLYQAFVDGGVPQGAINIVTGPGKPFGDVVVEDPAVDGIAFTGSKTVGMWLHREFSTRQPYIKPIVLEMGSKNPTIVTANADLDKAAQGVLNSAFGNGGQKCSATSRVYVENEILEEFQENLIDRTERLKVGDPRKRDTFYGPLIDERAGKTYLDAVSQARQDGGSILTGGAVLTGGLFDRGLYVRPTIVTGLPPGHPLVREELFVPFLVLDTFNSLGEAVSASNNTDFGLTAGIFSEDEGEITYFFKHIEFGTCYANRAGGATTGAWPGAQPFTGWKASGATGKGVGGPYYLLSFMREQAQTRVG